MTRSKNAMAGRKCTINGSDFSSFLFNEVFF
jgi:hypothetical protein